MNTELEQELCCQRILAIIKAKNKLANKLIEIGYPEEYPEKFKSLETAYENIRNAFLEAIYEEAKVLKCLTQSYRQ